MSFFCLENHAYLLSMPVLRQLMQYYNQVDNDYITIGLERHKFGFVAGMQILPGLTWLTPCIRVNNS